ncbi:MAG: hypothetical protein WAJ93_25020, partial [Candidatus Nitrosopolaris sp.]
MVFLLLNSLSSIDQAIHLCIVGGVVRNAFITFGTLLQQSQTPWETLSGIEVCKGNTMTTHGISSR